MATESLLAARCRYIPLRLTPSERAKLAVLEAALTTSEYTDKVDVMDYRSSKLARMEAQLQDLLHIVAGLMVCADAREARKLVQHETLADAEDLYLQVFEVGRRFKIMNPEKMRTTYGKLMHALMDAAARDVQQALGLSCLEPIQTVYGTLLHGGALGLLEEEDVGVATQEVRPGPDAGAQAQAKAAAVARLCDKYGRPAGGEGLPREEVERCLQSIGDSNAFLAYNRRPVERALELLHTHFSPKAPQSPELSLAISVGRNGARLSHSHATQFAYVEQSLRLWNEIMGEFYKLWTLAEEDLLDGRGYRLRDTGQGLNRVKDAPKVSAAMHHVMSKVRASAPTGWVGSSVVHMGDTDVPNALVFIDKYTQVPRILTPVVGTVDAVDELCKDPHVDEWVRQQFGSPEALVKAILVDFFRHGFDGSGADNYYDAGSCIDGRLTSAWNWCSRLEKKPFCVVFRLAGYNGFDGDFSR